MNIPSSPLSLSPTSRTWILIAMLLAVFVVFFIIQSYAHVTGHIDKGTCNSCHSGARATELGLKDFNIELSTYNYVHKVMEKGCRRCHLRNEMPMDNGWAIMGPSSAGEQIFFFTDLSPEGTYEMVLEMEDERERRVTLDPVEFVPLKVERVGKNTGKPPSIKEVDVIEVKYSVFNEALVRWTTNVPANTIVEYGLTAEYGKVVEYSKVYTTEHRIKLTGLRANAVYHYRVISRDLFGSASVSEDHTLDTSRAFQKTVVLDNAPLASSGMEATLFKVSRSGEVALRVLNVTPSKTFVRIRELIIFKNQEKHGFGLKSAKELTINLCVECHSRSLGITHPVGVQSRSENTSIPTNLPTIEDGMITCVTCHNPHGGKEKYFSRLPYKRDLCIECHTKGVFL